MTRKPYLTAFAATLAMFASDAVGQISITSGNLTYSQDFDTLTRSTTAESWTDNTATTSANDSPQVIGLAGWYVGNFGTTATTPQIRAGTGSGTAGSFYSFGSSAATDRALGTLPTDSTASASMRIGARFVNNTTETISGFTFSYDGEQWRQAALTPGVNNQFVVAYAIFSPGTGSLNSGLFSGNIAGATFDTPQDGSASGGALCCAAEPAAGASRPMFPCAFAKPVPAISAATATDNIKRLIIENSPRVFFIARADNESRCAMFREPGFCFVNAR